MKWGTDWVKLYRNPSSEWLALPVLVRGVGDELLRYVDRDTGRLYLGDEDVATVVCRRLGAHTTERRMVRACLRRLLTDGFCHVADGYLTVRNFVDAQTAVSPSAERMRAHRANAGRASGEREASARRAPGERKTSARRVHDERETSAPTDLSPRDDAPAPVTVTGIRVEESRVEERRTEEDPPNPPSGGTVLVPPKRVPQAPAAALALALVEPSEPDLVARVFAHWQRVLDHPRSVLDAKRRKTIAAALARHGVDDCLRAIDGCERSDWHMARPGSGNEGQRHDDVALILRDAAHVERFRALAAPAAAALDDDPVDADEAAWDAHLRRVDELSAQAGERLRQKAAAGGTER